MNGFIVGLDPEFPCAFRAEDARMIAVEETNAGGAFRVFIWVGDRQSILYFSGTKAECEWAMTSLLKRLDACAQGSYMEREGG